MFGPSPTYPVYRYPVPQWESVMYAGDADLREEIEAENADYGFTEIDVKEPAIPIDDSQYDRSAYLERVQTRYADLPASGHGSYRYWNPRRPAKQENLNIYGAEPTIPRLPVPGNPDEDRVRSFFKMPFQDSGMIDDEGLPVIGTATGLKATPHMERYELAFAPRSMKEEVSAYRATSKAPEAIPGRWVALAPYYQGVLGGKPKDTAIQLRKKFLGDVLPIGKNMDVDLGPTTWLTGGSLAHPQLDEYQTGNRLEQKRYPVSVTNFANMQRPTIVEGSFLDTTNFGQHPTITAASAVLGTAYDVPRIGAIVPPRHKGLYEELNRCPTADNTSFTGAAYYFKRGADSLKDTKYKPYTPGPGFIPPQRLSANNCPLTAQYCQNTREAFDTLQPMDREQYNEWLQLAPPIYQFNLQIAQELPENQLDTTAQNFQMLAPPIRWVESRQMAVPDYYPAPDEQPYPPRWQPPVSPEEEGIEPDVMDEPVAISSLTGAPPSIWVPGAMATG